MSIGRDELVRQFHAVDRMEGRVGAVAAHVIAKAPGTFSLRLVESGSEKTLTSEPIEALEGERLELVIAGLPLDARTYQAAIVQVIDGVEAAFDADSVESRDALTILFPREEQMAEIIAAAENKRAGLADDLRDLAATYENARIEAELTALDAQIEADRQQRRKDLMSRKIVDQATPIESKEQ